MRPIIINLFLTILFFAIVIKAGAQTCSGSLGDPVIYQTFGAGPNPGPALPSSVTNMAYTASNCPDDGYYTIVNAGNLNSSCHTTWQVVTKDHTGDPNGYMMLINASYAPSVFFTQTANGLCPNTTYEFSAYILNLITLAASIPGPKEGPVIEPNITFSVETLAGKVLATYNTGTIPPTSGPEWNKYGTYFVTPDGVTDVIVKMTNNAPGGNGNDLILDDIAFRACGPIVQAGFGTLSLTSDQHQCEGTSATYMLTASVGAGYNNPFLQWQVNYNNQGWTNITGETGTTTNIKLTNPVAGTYQYRIVAGEGQNINSPTCNVSSEALNVIVVPEPKVVAVVGPAPDVAICSGESVHLTASGGLYYKWTPSAGLDHDDIANPTATPTQTTTYQVNVSNDGCFDDTKSVTVTVNQLPTANAGGNRKLFEGQSIRLNGVVSGDEITSVYWTPTTGLDDPTSPNPIANPTESTLYTLHVTSQSCGIATDEATVTVYKKIVIPNTFTPNNDGVNDHWDIDALGAFPDGVIMVFTRNGQKVFESRGYPKPWDGTYNGAPVPGGTYYYIIDLKNNMPRMSGWVLIVR